MKRTTKWHRLSAGAAFFSPPMRAGALLLALALLLLAPAWAQRSDRAKRIGGRLWCMCGCNQILTQCNHVGCTTSTAMLKKLDQFIERNEPDDLTIQSFVQEYGAQVLAEPPAKGLALMGYVMPAVALLAGLGIVFLLLQHWRRGAATPAAAPAHSQITPEVLERARRQADAETDWETTPPAGGPSEEGS